jgi:hypothetical protein
VLQLNLLYIFSLVFFVVQDVALRLLQQNLVEILLVVVNVVVAMDVDDVVVGVDLMDQAYQAFVVVVGVVVVYDALTFVEFVVAAMDQGMRLEATFFVVVVVASEALKMKQHLNFDVFVVADAFEMVGEKLVVEVDLMENVVASFDLVDFLAVVVVVVVPQQQQQPLQLFDDVVVALVAKILLMIVRVVVQVASEVVELVPGEAAVVVAALVELVQDILVVVGALVASSFVDSILGVVVVAHTFVVGMDVGGTIQDVVEVVAVHQLQVVEVVAVGDIHLAFLDVVVVADMSFLDTFALKDVVEVARTFPLEVVVQVDLPRHFDFLRLMMRRKFVA